MEVGGVRLDRPDGHQHALQDPVRIVLEIVAILKRAGLALVAIHGEVARLGFLMHERPSNCDAA
jgi:hypothetical protein